MLVCFLIMGQVQAKHILLSYFDPFGGNPTNNSETIAKKIKPLFENSEHEVTLCKLNTVYDKAHEQLLDCYHSLDRPADFIVSLGETGCHQIKVETRGINYDRSYGPDNDGIERFGVEIIPGAKASLGVTLPMEKAFCSLSEEDRKKVYISHSAGSFVCNNTLYLGLTKFDIPYTFIHVPNAKCSSDNDNHKYAQIISDMITELATREQSLTAMPATKDEVKMKLNENLNSCESMFYRILRGEY